VIPAHKTQCRFSHMQMRCDTSMRMMRNMHENDRRASILHILACQSTLYCRARNGVTISQCHGRMRAWRQALKYLAAVLRSDHRARIVWLTRRGALKTNHSYSQPNPTHPHYVQISIINPSMRHPSFSLLTTVDGPKVRILKVWPSFVKLCTGYIGCD